MSTPFLKTTDEHARGRIGHDFALGRPWICSAPDGVGLPGGVRIPAEAARASTGHQGREGIALLTRRYVSWEKLLDVKLTTIRPGM